MRVGSVFICRRSGLIKKWQHRFLELVAASTKKTQTKTNKQKKTNVDFVRQEHFLQELITVVIVAAVVVVVIVSCQASKMIFFINIMSHFNWNILSQSFKVIALSNPIVLSFWLKIGNNWHKEKKIKEKEETILPFSSSLLILWTFNNEKEKYTTFF